MKTDYVFGDRVKVLPKLDAATEYSINTNVVEMEASVIAKMTVDKLKGFGFEDYILLFKHDNDLSWWEITKGVKLESFCNKDFKFGFIKTENIVK